MNDKIGVAFLVGLVFMTTIHIIKSDYFTKTQKNILGILIIFPPAQWILALIIGIWNKQTEATIGFKIDSVNKNNNELQKLKKLGVLTEQEYNEKAKKVLQMKSDELFLKSEQYNSLKKLKKKNILTQEEFEQKTEILKNKIISKIDFSESNEIIESEQHSGNSKSAKIITIVILTLFFGMILLGIIIKFDVN